MWRKREFTLSALVETPIFSFRCGYSWFSGFHTQDLTPQALTLYSPSLRHLDFEWHHWLSQFFSLYVADHGTSHPLKSCKPIPIIDLLLSISYWFSLCPHIGGHHPTVCVLCTLIYSSCRDASRRELWSIGMVSFYIHFLAKGPLSKYSHILRYRVLGLLHKNLRGGHNSPITQTINKI